MRGAYLPAALLCAFVPSSAAEKKVAFASDVAPLLKARCVPCHGAGQSMSGLRLDEKKAALAGGYSGPVIRPGDVKGSKLLARVQGAPGVMAMPPAGPRLTAAEIATLRSWIEQGAEWPDGPAPSRPGPSANKSALLHWAFRPPEAPPVPPGAANPIDAFIGDRLKREAIAPSPAADLRTQYRRLSFDLVGLPPSPEEMQAFLDDKAPGAWERAVDRLLASPHFGERWARPWLDRARYADSDGYEKDWFRPYAWRYRQWVIDAFNRDLPFDRFTVEQIAGDLLPGGGIDAKVAAGFHRQTLTNREGGVDNAQFLFESAIDRTNTVSAAWLGLTAGCAQCHDHKYDPITQRDYYSLFAFFEPLEEVEADAPMPGELGPWLATRADYREKRTKLLAEYNVPALQDDWEKEMLDASAHPGKRTDWDLAWDCLLKLTEGGDGERIIRIPPARRTERQRDVLTDHFIRNYHFAVGQKRYKELKLPELDQKLRELKEQFPQLSQAMTVEEPESAPPTHLRVRGDYRTNGIEVPRAAPAFLPRIPAARPTRLDFAKWVVAPENPLTARVAVNWIWQELFGRGLVKSSDDFGTRGDKPSHPELLDWLAVHFREDGWSVKSVIRRIATSETYRQSSRFRPDLLAKDPDNALLARQNRVRLPAELIRDAALEAAGLLDLTVGGRSVRPPQPAGVTSLGYGKKDDSGWKESTGRDRYRRGLYIHLQRSTPYPLLANFDAPKASVAQCSRERSNTALQALNLLNDPVFVEAAAALAFLASDGSFEQRVDTMYRRALGRPAESGELSSVREHHRRLLAIFDADPAKSRELADTPEKAAWTAVASAILNLDEFITRE